MNVLAEWLLQISEPLIKAVLIPLAWLIAVMGQGNMGISDQEMVDKYVYITEDQVTGVAGTACNTTTLRGGGLCRPYLQETRSIVPTSRAAIVVFSPYWSDHSAIPHIVRHEMEHLLRADGLRPGNTYDEDSVRSTTCEIIYHPLYCY